MFEVNKRKPGYPADLQKAETALDAMEVLCHLLKSGEVNHLIAPARAANLHTTQYNSKMSPPSGEGVCPKLPTGIIDVYVYRSDDCYFVCRSLTSSASL